VKRLEAEETRNITLALPRELLRRLKRLAVERDSSISATVRDLIEDAVRADDAYERAHRRWREDVKQARNLGTYGKRTWTRDELHERR
jgi:predicted transcriptional regulator